MDFKLLHLKNTRRFVASPSLKPVRPDRRSFIKTMGIGIFSVNPIVGTFKAISFNPFEIRQINTNLFVTRHEKIVWEISDRFFEKGFDLKITSNDQSYSVSACNLKVRNTGLQFSLSAKIAKTNNEWMMKITIPELSINQETPFLEWLDRIQTINSTQNIECQLIRLDEKDSIELKGKCRIELSSSWDISFGGTDLVMFKWQGDKYLNDNLTLAPFDSNTLSFLKPSGDNSVSITIPGFKGWSDKLSHFQFYENNRISFNQDTPDLHLLLQQLKDGNLSKIVWASEEKGNLHFWPDSRMEVKFLIDRYFYFSEYTQLSSPQF